MTGPDPTEAAARVVAAYNEKDFARLRQLLSPSIVMSHFNRNYSTNSRDALLETMALFAEQLMTNRQFEPPERVLRVGDLSIREGYWGGTATCDIPGFAGAGEVVRVKLCSLMRFDANGILLEWTDYG